VVKAHTEWTVLPHDDILELGPDLWVVDGRLPKPPFRRRMTLARRADGRVVVHNFMALRDEAMERIEAWGEPAELLVPGAYHRLDAGLFRQRYPAAKVYCPAGARHKVEEVVPVDGDYRRFEADDRVFVAHLDGTDEREGYLRVREESGSLNVVLNDLVFNLPKRLPGLQGWIYARLLGAGGGPKVTRLARWLLVDDAAEVRTQLQRLAGLPNLRRVIVSHGNLIDRAASDVLLRVAGTL